MTDGSSQGLFVIVAVVIFGIFVLISYILFRDTMKPSLSSIFTDGLEQAESNLNGEEIDNSGDIVEHSDIKKGNFIFVEYSKDSYLAYQISGDGVSLVNTVSKTIIDNWDGSDDYGILGVTPEPYSGSLNFPDKIDSYKIKGIGSSTNAYGIFENVKFTGNLKLPKYLERIEDRTFSRVDFRGTLEMPETLKYIGNFAFESSKFSEVIDNKTAQLGVMSIGMLSDEGFVYYYERT